MYLREIGERSSGARRASMMTKSSHRAASASAARSSPGVVTQKPWPPQARPKSAYGQLGSSASQSGSDQRKSWTDRIFRPGTAVVSWLRGPFSSPKCARKGTRLLNGGHSVRVRTNTRPRQT